MPRKTRRQKSRAQKRGYTIHLPTAVQETLTKSVAPSATVTIQPIPEHHTQTPSLIEQQEKQAIRHDILKTIGLTTFAIIGEVILLNYFL